MNHYFAVNIKEEWIYILYRKDDSICSNIDILYNYATWLKKNDDIDYYYFCHSDKELDGIVVDWTKEVVPFNDDFYTKQGEVVKRLPFCFTYKYYKDVFITWASSKMYNDFFCKFHY